MAKATHESSQATLQRMIAIGDIHGCATALAALLGAIDPGPGDEVITLGDHIDRGPDTRGVLEQLLTLAGRCRLVPLLGNHEEMFLAALAGHADFQYWLRFGGEETLASYGGSGGTAVMTGPHIEFLKSCREFYETTAHIFVHANYDPDLPMNRQSTGILLWKPLHPRRTAPHCSAKTVVLGHTVQPNGRILDLGHVLCIDTYCYGGGWLTGLDVRSGQFWQANERGEVRGGQIRCPSGVDDASAAETMA